MFRLLIVLIFTTIIAQSVFTQEDWRDGYVITLSVDTLHGQIKHQNYQLMGQQCLYRTSPDGQIKKYNPIDIKGYGLKNSAYYITSEIDSNQTVFLEYLVNGKLDLFYLREYNGDRFFIKTDSLPLKEIKYFEEQKLENGKEYITKSKMHIGLLSHYTKDAPDLYRDIVKINLDFKTLKKLSVNYHNMVCKDETCITYRNKESYTKVAFGPQFGITSNKYFDGKKTVLGNYLSSGLFLRAWSPRMHKNIYFRTGILYTRFDYFSQNQEKVKKYSIIKIPAQIEFVIPTSIFLKPKVTTGADFTSLGDVNLTAGFGTDINLSKKLTMSVVFENELIGLGNLTYYRNIIAGLYYQL